MQAARADGVRAVLVHSLRQPKARDLPLCHGLFRGDGLGHIRCCSASSEISWLGVLSMAGISCESELCDTVALGGDWQHQELQHTSARQLQLALLPCKPKPDISMSAVIWSWQELQCHAACMPNGFQTVYRD